MKILRAVIGGIAGVLIGCLAAAFPSSVVMGWLGVSDFEGRPRGMTAAFAFGPQAGASGARWTSSAWLGSRRP